MTTQKKQIALFKNIPLDFDVLRSKNDEQHISSEFIRISEWVEVEFVTLSDKDILDKKVDAINAERKKAAEILDRLQIKKQRLLL